MNKKSIVLTITALLSFSGFTSAEYLMKFNNSQSKGMIPAESSQEFYSSCKDILDNGKSTGDGVYSIKVNSKEFDVYCDMTSAGGGWTMVVAQFEQDPVTNWNEGIQPDYDPSLSTKKGFTLSSQEIPSHTQTAFGKDFDADSIEYINFQYLTSNIEKQLVYGLKNNKDYHIYRKDTGHYPFSNPEEPFNTELRFKGWRNSFSIDSTGGRGFDWSVSPNIGNYPYSSFDKPHSVGYAFDGNELVYTEENFAWTVWVR